MFLVYLKRIMLNIKQTAVARMPPKKIGIVIAPTAPDTKNPSTAEPKVIFDRSEKYCASESV